MKIGLTGDTHNNLTNIKKICQIFNSVELVCVFHTGDITLPKSLESFCNLIAPLKGVFGNNDQEEKSDLIKICKKYNFDFSGESRVDHISNRLIHTVHDPQDINRKYLKENNIILHGHTHRFRNERINGATIFNPGECAGFMKGSNKIGIIDLELIEMETINF